MQPRDSSSNALSTVESGRDSAHGLIQTARGMCTDEAPHVEIEQILSRAVDAVKDLEDEFRDRLSRIIYENREALDILKRNGD